MPGTPQIPAGTGLRCSSCCQAGLRLLLRVSLRVISALQLLSGSLALLLNDMYGSHPPARGAGHVPVPLSLERSEEGAPLLSPRAMHPHPHRSIPGLGMEHGTPTINPRINRMCSSSSPHLIPKGVQPPDPCGRSLSLLCAPCCLHPILKFLSPSQAPWERPIETAADVFS